MKQGVANKSDPWYPAFINMSGDPLASASYVMKGPMTFATRNATGSSPGKTEISSDAVAAVLNALMYVVLLSFTLHRLLRISRFYITGNETHAAKSTEILVGWSNTLQLLNGTDAQLTAGLYGPQFANAAEIIRAYYPAWNETEISKFKSMLLNIFYPVASTQTPTAIQPYPLYELLNLNAS